jgi:RNA polymerase sigma-70 factor (ECF subfamily)
MEKNNEDFTRADEKLTTKTARSLIQKLRHLGNTPAPNSILPEVQSRIKREQEDMLVSASMTTLREHVQAVGRNSRTALAYPLPEVVERIQPESVTEPEQIGNREHLAPLQQLSEVERVAMAQHGNQAAFESLYEQYYRPLAIYTASMVGNDSIVVDLVQEAFLQAWRTLPRLREPSHFKSWLYRIATSVASAYQKRSDHQNPTNLAEQASEAELLQAALAAVSPTYRACLILYVIEELPANQIADILHIKEASVRTYVSRGKEELRQIYHRLLMERDNKDIPGNK